MADVALQPSVATHNVLLEARGGGIRLKIRGFPAVHLPWDAAVAVAREIQALAAAAARVRR